MNQVDQVVCQPGGPIQPIDQDPPTSPTPQNSFSSQREQGDVKLQNYKIIKFTVLWLLSSGYCSKQNAFSACFYDGRGIDDQKFVLILVNSENQRNFYGIRISPFHFRSSPMVQCRIFVERIRKYIHLASRLAYPYVSLASCNH